MNVLFITLLNMENVDERGIYTDLVRELASRGINMHVVFPRERRTKLPTELTSIRNIKLLKVRTGNITKTSFIEKGLSTLTIDKQYLKAVKKYLKDVRFDLVIYSTPPITFVKVVNYLKKKHESKTYLLLKDIFPQNAVDIDLIKNRGFIWRYFRKKEKKLYQLSDKIGCMSKGNVNYILQHNSFIDKRNVEVFPNSIEPVEIRVNVNKEIYKKYHISEESTLFVYGGNLGKPQGINFILKVIENFHKVDSGHLLIVGSGTEYKKIEKHIHNAKPKNVSLHKNLPKKEYDKLLENADVGLIFLDKRFTIPNFPSRLTSYLEYSLPILAATDKNTDLKDILSEAESGLWSESEDIESFIDNAKLLSTNKELRTQLGLNGRKYLEAHYNIKETVNIIIKHL
ncbi:glycosyltransferase family 4 protein [Peribacillus sp. NPDC097206]|uniref:glycosyltransferase family 4 protein n=1 Tax=Peribacillus sp. NPDC097206 TaxID=3364398 RepID=UPI003822FFAD